MPIPSDRNATEEMFYGLRTSMLLHGLRVQRRHLIHAHGSTASGDGDPPTASQLDQLARVQLVINACEAEIHDTLHEIMVDDAAGK